MSNIEKRYFRSWPRLIRRALIVLVVVAILVFLGVKINAIFSPPPLVIISPDDGSVISEKQVEIVGRSEPETEVVINNRPAVVDSDGMFKVQVDLQKGLNLIKITAKKRYSGLREAEVRVLLK